MVMSLDQSEFSLEKELLRRRLAGTWDSKGKKQENNFFCLQEKHVFECISCHNDKCIYSIMVPDESICPPLPVFCQNSLRALRKSSKWLLLPSLLPTQLACFSLAVCKLPVGGIQHVLETLFYHFIVGEGVQSFYASGF